MENQNGQDVDSSVRGIERTLRDILSPVEPLVMRIQSLLVWEYPRRSAVMFICVHGIFWFLATTSLRFYFLVSFTTLMCYFISTWKKKIWPEIRVPPPVPEDLDGWTPVHPRLLNVPEICLYLAQLWHSVILSIKGWIVYRKYHPKKFFVLSSTSCVLLALIGHYIPGIMLSYIFVISIMLWPCVLYHNLLKRFYLKFEPIFMRLDYTMKLKAKWTFRGRKASKSSESQKPKNSNAGEPNSVETADTDSELEEFCPSPDPATTAALARAITDSEDESPGTPSLSTPRLSKEPSVDTSDNEHHADLESEFAQGMGEMPSFDDNLDHTDDELLMPDTAPVNSQESMHFVPSHFDDSSGSEEDTLGRDLSYQDLAAADTVDIQQQIRNVQNEAVASMASALVTQTFTTVMESALQGLTRLTEQAQAPDTANRVSYNKDKSQDTVDIQAAADDRELPRQQSAESSEIDIAEEFEFLNEYELEDDPEQEKPV